MAHRLIIPFDVEGILIDVIDRRHPEHLAGLATLRGDGPQVYTKFATVVRWADAEGLRLSGDTVPACLLGTIGAPDLIRNEDNGIDVVLQIGAQVTVMGQRRRDVLLRRDVMAWSLAECLIQRVPRSSDGVINSVRMTDYEPLSEGDKQRTLGDARMIFEVSVPNMLSFSGYLPADDSDWPPEAGGAPVDPADPIPDRPLATPTFTFDRRPIVE